MTKQIIVRVPASTSNLGPGFDCLGIALRLHNEIMIERGQPARLPAIVHEAAELFFKTTRQRPFPFSCSARERVPRMRGLGSSATIRLGVLEGLNAICRAPLDRVAIFRLATSLERHPDNAAPSLFGGFTVARGEMVQQFPVSSRLYFVLLVPNFEIKTTAARRILPRKILRPAAVENCANACTITAAFASREYEKLRGAFFDRLHQPFRMKLIPMLPRVIAAAEKAGALGAFLSGSGSTICAITLKNKEKVAVAMQRAAGSVKSETIITTADNLGLRIRHSSQMPVRLGLTRH